MALQYVGGTSGAGTSTGYTVSLSGTLTGGIASSPAAGDIVVVFSGFGNTASSAPAVSGNTSGAYQPATAAQHINDTWDTEFRSFYQVMGSTPDTTLTITRVTNAAYGGVTTVQVWRGADTVAPFIGAATPASAGNAGIVNPPAYNPAVTGAIIIAGGGGTLSTTGTAYGTLTGMSNTIALKSDGTTSDFYVVMASYAYAGVSYDPPAATGGSGSGTSSSWAGVTLALRPQPDVVDVSLAATEAADTAAFSLFEVTELSLAATEAADSASMTVTVNASLAATEAADTAAFAFEEGPSDTPLSLAATEGADSAAATVTVNASLAAAEGADTAAATVHATAALAATEAADTASATVTVNASLAATEGADTAAFALAEFVENGLALDATEAADTAEALIESVVVEPPPVERGTGGVSYTRPRREKPLPARKLISYEDTIVLERLEAVVEAVRTDPIEQFQAWQDTLAHEIGALRTILVRLKAENDASERRAQDLLAQTLAEAENLLKRKRREAEALARRQREDDEAVLKLFAAAMHRPFGLIIEEET